MGLMRPDWTHYCSLLYIIWNKGLTNCKRGMSSKSRWTTLKLWVSSNLSGPLIISKPILAIKLTSKWFVESPTEAQSRVHSTKEGGDIMLFRISNSGGQEALLWDGPMYFAWVASNSSGFQNADLYGEMSYLVYLNNLYGFCESLYVFLDACLDDVVTLEIDSQRQSS